MTGHHVRHSGFFQVSDTCPAAGCFLYFTNDTFLQSMRSVQAVCVVLVVTLHWEHVRQCDKLALYVAALYNVKSAFYVNKYMVANMKNSPNYEMNKL